jgi:hypothetical protein
VANEVHAGDTGGYTLSVQGGRGGNDGYSPQGTGGTGTLSDLARMRLPTISSGQTVRGALTTNSFTRSDDGTFANGYIYNGRAGETITVTMRSTDLDSWLVIDDPNGPMHEFDDDSGGGNDSRLTVTLPHDGPYLIVANTVSKGVTGSYTLTVQSGNASMIQKLP